LQYPNVLGARQLASIVKHPVTRSNCEDHVVGHVAEKEDIVQQKAALIATPVSSLLEKSRLFHSNKLNFFSEITE
jgi:hypothetical protein